ncbi:winged helix DNA-binding domain-containing protein [Mycolicibacterium sp. P9-64]|uniref:winged helix DNA-binding domain-containing protein n=1 Tax=Mycolicibacterium sp. P9-64 TaxID=2024612 RepID=UPI0011ED9FD6|nr:winged helix DNA-binding domain-containing protein [Mycolicibacterium sp. P9-64]KAA0084169.1 winged helix DNA-binding domain-containing protein [Mycolicibacterium sp. P9-64]
MRSFTVDERRARLARRHLLTAEPNAASITDVCSQLVGLHATDPTTPYLSLWARMPGFEVADLEAALYQDRSVVKHLAMRRTLWVLTAGDLAAVQTAASDRVAANERKRLIADVQRAGIADDGEKWLGHASKAVLAHVQKHGPTGARELREALPQLAGHHDPAPGKPWGGATPVAPRVLTVLAVEGLLVRGTNDGTWTTARPRWTSASAWLGAAEGPAAADAARSAVVLAWLRAFGPATVNDLKWWFGSTLTWARAGLRDVGAVEVDLHGTPGYVLPDDLDPEPHVDPWCALLPGLDVTTMGWQARDWYLGQHGSQVFDTRGNAGPTAWYDGRVVGGWRQDDEGRVVVQLLEDVGAKASKAFARKADQLTDWLNGVRINPRFPSPLTKS